MTHEFGAGVLVVGILFCLMTTWISGAKPAAFAERLGLTVANPGGVNEVRAQYAGFFLAIAAVCAAALAGLLPREAAFVVLGTVFGGLIAGRLASLALNGGVVGYTPSICALYVIDSLGFALAAAAFMLDTPGAA